MLPEFFRKNTYIIKMALASALLLLKVYLASFLLDEGAFSNLLSLYYLGNVLVVVLPFGSLLFMHSQLPAEVAREDPDLREALVGDFMSLVVTGTTVLGALVFLVWWLVGGFEANAAAVVFGWAYAVSQLAILRTKVFRSYDRYGNLLIVRALLMIGAVMTAIGIGWPILGVILSESIGLLLFSGWLLRGMSLRLSRGLSWARKTLNFAIPSIVGAVFANLDRLIAAWTLTDQNLARFGIIYLMVGITGTVAQFVNTRFLPELFIASRGGDRYDNSTPDLFPGIERTPKVYMSTGVIAWLGALVACWMYSYLTPFEYSGVELVIVSIACIARVSELIGSIGIVRLGVNLVCVTQILTGALVAGIYAAIRPDSVSAAVAVSVALNSIFATIILIASFRRRDIYPVS
jgi:hypothetical protein